MWETIIGILIIWVGALTLIWLLLYIGLVIAGRIARLLGYWDALIKAVMRIYQEKRDRE